jgi:general secretion pathway protein A
VDDGWLADQHRLAWRSLAELWRDGGHAGALAAACDGAPRMGYGCVRDAGSWARIRQLGLPVLLVLNGPERRLLLLRGFGPDSVLVGNADPPQRVAREALEDRWLGEYLLAWPQAVDWPSELRRGDAGAAVDIVMQMAALADPAWRGGDRFDAAFETWLMDFQRRRGLDADGIIGPNTLIHLLAPTVEQPRLTLDDGERS